MNPMTTGTTPTRSLRTPESALRVVGVGSLLATGGIHLDLYLTGYHEIPTIGVLFLAQVASAFALGLVLAVRGGWLTCASGAGFLASTIGGYLLSRAFGLFGFHEVPTTAGLVAGLVELGGLLALGGAAVLGLRRSALSPPLVRASGPALGALGAVALALVLLAGIGSASSPTRTAAAPSGGAGTGGASITIVITNFTYSPARASVHPGERILVKNEDTVAHTLTAMPGTTPLGTFDTGNIAPGATASIVAPKKAGSYAYYCSIHNFMTGVLTVS
jgi:plastocyanin